MLRSSAEYALCLLAGLSLASACSSDGDDTDGGMDLENPQILPDVSPICLGTPEMRITVGDTVTHNVLLTNYGRKTLTIESAELAENTSGFYEFVGLADEVVENRDQAIARFTYSPQSEGWHDAYLDIVSNAENLPMLRIYVLGLAQPVGTSSTSPYDPGKKPDNAFLSADPACPQFDGM